MGNEFGQYSGDYNHPGEIQFACDLLGVTLQTGHYSLVYRCKTFPILYADDIVLFLSRPIQSLRCLDDLIKQYGHVSGYKINGEKSVSMGFRITTALKQQIWQ